MFDKLVMLTDGQTIYKGQVKTLVPFLAGIGLECPSYHNPVRIRKDLYKQLQGSGCSTAVEHRP